MNLQEFEELKRLCEDEDFVVIDTETFTELIDGIEKLVEFEMARDKAIDEIKANIPDVLIGNKDYFMEVSTALMIEDQRANLPDWIKEVIG